MAPQKEGASARAMAQMTHTHTLNEASQTEKTMLRVYETSGKGKTP